MVSPAEDGAVVRDQARRRLPGLLHRNRLLVLAALALLVFLFLLDEVLEGEVMRLDMLAYGAVVMTMRTDWLTPVMETFSALATPVVLLAMLIAIGAFAPGRRPGWCAACNLVLATLLNLLLKSLVRRERPVGYRLVAETGFSFPSGHSMVAMAFYGFLAWLAYRTCTTRRERAFYLLAFSVLIICVGFSRIYLGVHYASDVIAGFCVSLV